MGFAIPARRAWISRCEGWRLFSLFCWALWVPQDTGFAADPIIPTSALGYRPDRILVQPKHGTSLFQLNQFNVRNQTKVLGTIRSPDGLQLVSVPAHETVMSVVRKYQASGLVEFAEPDYLVRTAATVPDDPKYLDGTLWGLNQIDAPGAWDVQTSASNVVVAVLDTGVRYTHQDLAANMWVSPVDQTHGLNALSGTNDPSDDSGHGTIVAGVLGAVGNNGIGVAGVAWQVQILACKCFDKFGVGDISSIITCLEFARTNNARLINASWGLETNSVAFSNELYTVRDAGIILIAAAGNSATNIDIHPNYPSSYHFDNVVSVAYSTRQDTLGVASNFGATSVHIAAPGEGIYSTFAASDSYYYTLSGSSVAAPFVTGAFALILAQYPGESYQESIARLLNGADPIPALAGSSVTGGRLNLRNALRSPVRLTANPGASSGFPQFQVVSAPQRICAVQQSSDLLTWIPILTNTTSSAGIFGFTTAPATNALLRFYRAVAFQ